MPDLISQQGFDEQNLPRRGKAKTLKTYRDRIKVARQFREQEDLDDTWKRMRDIYRLRMFSEFDERDRIAVAVGFATVNVIAPSVAVNLPKLIVWPTQEDPDHVNKAKITEGALNYWWRRYDFKKPIRRCVKDSLIYGTGIAKVGWRYETREVDRDPDEIAADLASMSENLNEMAAQRPDEAAAMPTDDELAANAPQTEVVVTEDRPFVERVSPFDFYVDPEATSEDDWKWCAQRTVRELAEVRVDARYKPSARKKVKADVTIDAVGGGEDTWRRAQEAVDQVQESDRVVIWEFYDLVRGEMCVFSENGDGFLVDPVDMPYPFGVPFVLLPNYEVPDAFWALGDLQAMEPLQHELNETRSAMVTARDLDIPKFFYRRDELDPQAIEALRSKTPWQGVPVDGDTPFAELIAQVPRPQASPMLYDHSTTIENDIDLVTGVSEYQRGEVPETRRTATEASIIQDAANARAADKLAQVEEFISQIGRRIVQLAQQYMTGEAAARASGSGAAMVLWTFTADDIEGEFDFEVEAGSTQPRNETFRRQQAQQMMNTLAPFIGTFIDPYAILSKVLTEGYGIKDPAPFFMAPQMPAGPEGQAPPGDAENPTEGAAPEEEADPEAQARAQQAQLAGQVGLDLNNMGGGALGPGAA